VLPLPFEQDFQEIAKINSEQEKLVFSNRKNWFPQNTKNRQSAKINSRKTLVLHGNLDLFYFILFLLASPKKTKHST